MISSSNLLLAIAVVLLTGLAFGKLCKLIHIPNVTGYLVGGLLVGPGLLGLIPGFDGVLGHDTVESMKVIVNIELAFIAFTIGIGFKKDYIKKIGAKPIIMAFLESFLAVIVISGLILCFTPILTKNLNLSTKEVIAFAIALGSIGAATAPAATLMVIKQYRARGTLTDTLVAVVAIDDASALIFFGIAMAIVEILSPGGSSNLALSISLPFIEILISVAIGIVGGAILCFLIHYFHGRGTRISCTVATVLGSAGLVMLFNELGKSINLNVSDLFAVMILGAVFTNCVPERDEAQVNELFERFTPPFVIMFFVLSGAELDFKNFTDVRILLVLLICIGCYVLGRTAGKYLGVLGAGELCHCERKITRYLSLGLMPQGGVALGLSVMIGRMDAFKGTTQGVIIQTTIIASCFLTELFGPLFTKYMLFKAGEADPALK